MANRLIDSEKQETYFKPNSWLAKTNYINHLVLFSNVLMAVIAEKGGGKTTFIKLLQSSLDADIQTSTFTATATFSGNQLLRHLTEVLQLQAEADGSILMDKLVQQVNERQKHVLVLIDDAQYLPENFLKELLTNLKNQETKHFFHVCLFSDLSLNNSLNPVHRAEFKNFIHIIEPGSLSEIETKTYIYSRLTSKDFDKLLTDERLDQFYHLTKGNIARINLHLPNFFLPTEREKPKSYTCRLIFATVMLLAIFVNSTYWWYEQKEMLYRDGVAKRAKILQDMEANEAIEFAKAQEKLLRTSQILPYYESSVYMAVQSAPLRQVLADLDEDLDSFQDNLVLMDKVVVIPNPRAIANLTTPDMMLQSKLLPIKNSTQNS